MKASQINLRIHNSKDSFIIGAMLPCYSEESVFLILARYFETRTEIRVYNSISFVPADKMYASLPPRSPWRPSRKDSGLIKSWFVLHLANFLSGYRLKPLNRPTAEVPPICRVYSASVRRFSRDGRLGKVGWKGGGGGGERGVERNGTIAVGTQSHRANPRINRRGTNVYQVAVVRSRLSCQTFRTFREVFLLARFAIVSDRLLRNNGIARKTRVHKSWLV